MEYDQMICQPLKWATSTSYTGAQQPGTKPGAVDGFEKMAQPNTVPSTPNISLLMFSSFFKAKK